MTFREVIREGSEVVVLVKITYYIIIKYLIIKKIKNYLKKQIKKKIKYKNQPDKIAQLDM